MKAIRLFTLSCFLLGTINFAWAQGSIEEMVKDWERAKAYTKEYLETMPESGYALKPTPEVRSFAEQMLHLTDANYAFAGQASGVKGPDSPGGFEKTTDKSKENVTSIVMAGYDFVIENLKKMKPEQMGEKVKIFDRFEMTKGSAFAKCFEHQTHHRGQTTVYIRLAGAKPPQEKLF
jgi:uncharacterized damage-inducible protein DinB